MAGGATSFRAGAGVHAQDLRQLVGLRAAATGTPLHLPGATTFLTVEPGRF